MLMEKQSFQHAHCSHTADSTQETNAMDKCTKIWILLIFLSNSNCDTLNYSLIKDYLLWNNINVTLFITCERLHWSDDDDEKMMMDLKNDDIWISVWDMSRERNLSNFNYDHFLLRSGYQFSVIVDWYCSGTSSMLKELSKRKMFHYERHWLMFGTDADEMFNVLSRESINIDAEVAIVVPINRT